LTAVENLGGGAPATALKMTPLNAEHHAAGAKMTGFAGWEMPLHYGSQIEEHHSVRRAAGMFDVSHMLAVDVLGPGARDFLRRLLANDVARLGSPGKALYSCMLNEAGGVLDDLIAYFVAENRYRLVVNAGTADRDLAWMKRQCPESAQFEVLARRDLAMIAVQGPRAREKFWSAMPQLRKATERLSHFEAVMVGDMMAARTGYTGEDGFEIMLPAADAANLWQALKSQGVAVAGLGARDTLRLEAGMNLYGSDMDESVSPFESGLAWTVDLRTQRDFIGRAALLARPVTHHLAGLVLLDKGIMRGHHRVRCAAGGHEPAGELTSGGFSPTLNRSIGLARVSREVAAGDTIEVEVRGKWLRAKAIKPPFVRNGRILVAV
jgi:aminomethyltransferase